MTVKFGALAGLASAFLALPAQAASDAAGVAPGHPLTTGAAPSVAAPPLELHQRLDTRAAGHERDIALTLDACGGGFDERILGLLVQQRVPATLFVTRRWLRQHAAALREIQAHADLFEIQNHGAEHVPAVVGRRLYGMAGPADAGGIAREIQGGAQAIVAATGATAPPQWYRGAGAAYDLAAQQLVAQLGLHLAGFSLNADAGATLGAAAVAQRLLRAQPGDIVIAHINKPGSGTAQGLAQALPALQQRGLRFVKLSQAAGVHPVK